MIDYDAELQLHHEQFRATLDIRPTDRVLDVGCGAGQTPHHAAEMASGGSVLGVDIDPGMIALARRPTPDQLTPLSLGSVGAAVVPMR